MANDSPDTWRQKPEGDYESKLSAIWQEALALDVLPKSTDDFFFLGGDSTAMLMVELRIREDMSVDLPHGSIIGAPSLRELASLIKRLKEVEP